MKKRAIALILVVAGLSMQGCAVAEAWDYAMEERKNYRGPDYVTAGYIYTEPTSYRSTSR